MRYSAMTHVTVRIKLEAEGLAQPEELAVRNELADYIEHTGIGTVIGSGSGRGEMDIGVELANADFGERAIRVIARQLGIRGIVIDGE